MIATIMEPPTKAWFGPFRPCVPVTLVLDSDLRGDVGGTVSVHPRGCLY